MSDTEVTTQREPTGRFVNGHKSISPGRPVGSRSKLGEAFLEDLRDAWIEYGATALARCAKEEPAQFCRIVAGLLPRDLNINVAVDAGSFASTFRAAAAMLGNSLPETLPRRRMKVIENAGNR